jgi:hypothetical protein
MIKNFKDWNLNEAETAIESVDKAPDRLKDTRGYATKPPKVVYLKNLSKFGEKVLNFTKTETKEKELFALTSSVWLGLYMEQKGEEVFKKGDIKDPALVYASSSASDLQKNEILTKIGDSKDLDYIEIHKLAFKEFNIYKVKAYGYEKTSSYGVYYSLNFHRYWFITKKDALLSGNAKARDIMFGLADPEEEKGPTPSWAILTVSNPYRSSDKSYGWARNDGHDDPIASSKDFKKMAQRMANSMAQRQYVNWSDGSVKIYTNKDKFIADFQKLNGSTPKL